MSDTHVLLLGAAAWGILLILLRVDRRITGWAEEKARRAYARREERAVRRVIATAEQITRESCGGGR